MSSVHQTHLRPVAGERHREVDRDRRFPDPALARGDRDGVLHAGQDRCLSGACSCCITFEVIVDVHLPDPAIAARIAWTDGRLQLLAHRDRPASSARW